MDNMDPNTDIPTYNLHTSNTHTDFWECRDESEQILLYHTLHSLYIRIMLRPFLSSSTTAESPGTTDVVKLLSLKVPILILPPLQLLSLYHSSLVDNCIILVKKITSPPVVPA